MGVLIFCFILSVSILGHVQAYIDGLYCGKWDCYAVLGVSRDASKAEIGKAYRQLAKKYHPDMHRMPEAKKKAEEKFTALGTAYEILKDDESRKDYDDMLDSPEDVYRHYYRYYRRSYAPKVDARIVIAVTITVISCFQFFCSWSRYHTALNHLITVPKYRMKAMEIAKQEKLFETTKKRDKRSKEEIKHHEDSVLRKILEERMDIRGGYSKPSILDILWLQLLLLPYTIVRYILWNIYWICKFNLFGHEYGEKEKYYLIKKNMRCSDMQWEAIELEDREVYLRRELWKKDIFKLWKEEKEAEIRAKLAESARYKSYRRYMKNRGPGQLTFEA